MKRWIVACALALAGCGGDEPTSPASVVPAEAAVYASFDTSGRTLAMPAAYAGARPDDLRPWIGERAALFALADVPNRAALVLEVADEDGARAFARETAVDGQLVTAMVEGYLVVAEGEELLAAARATAEGGEALDASAEAGTAAYVGSRDTRILSGLLPRLGLDRYAEKLVVGTVPADARLTARLWTPRGATVLEVEGAGDPHPPAPAPAIADLPASTWFAVADGDVGSLATAAAMVETVAFGQIESALGIDVENDVLPHLGAGTFYVEDATANDTAARAVVEVRDPPALRRAIAALAREQRRRPGARVSLWRDGGRTWVTLADRPPVAVLGDFRLTVAKGRLTAEFGVTGGVSQKLADTEWFRAAERHLGAPPTLYADLIRLRQDLPGTGVLGDAAVLAASASERDGRRVQRFVLLAG